jgi:predicted metal-dependent phosphoesterase TrpH
VIQSEEDPTKLSSSFDLHVHTNRGSPDSSLTPEEMVAEAQRMGLTGIMVTEHDGWQRYDFDRFASSQDLVLVRALEVYTPLGHMIALGLDGHVTGFSGDIEQVRDLRIEIDRRGGFLILAHPFRFFFDLQGVYSQNILFRDATDFPTTAEEAARHPVFDLVHEVEVVNGGNIEVENRFAQSVTKVLGRSGTGGSDAHSLQGLARGTTVFAGDIRNERDLMEALRAGDFYPVEGFHVGRPVAYGPNSSDDGAESS